MVTGIAAPAHVDISLWRLDRSPDEVARLGTLLSADEATRAGRFVRTVDRDRWVVSRAGLRLLLSRAMNVAPGALVFGREGNGRPTANGGGALSFNLSHSADVGALAVSFDACVGVDVEEIRPIEHDEIRWALSPAEQEELALVGEGQRLETFFRFWTLKEAFMKGMGLGAVLPLHDFDTRLDDPRLIRLKDRPDEPGAWKFNEISPRAGMRGAIAARTEGRALVANWQWAELH
jgi:4'-phosphopantetheinyl transferase